MTTSFAAFETGPGKLLKTTADTSNEKFAQAADRCDVSALCGHLVSLIVLNKGPERTPLALLSNHVQTALLKMNAASLPSDVPGKWFNPIVLKIIFNTSVNVFLLFCCCFKITVVARGRPGSCHVGLFSTKYNNHISYCHTPHSCK